MDLDHARRRIQEAPDTQIREALTGTVYTAAEDAWDAAYAAALATGGGHRRSFTIAHDAWRTVIVNALVPVVRGLVEPPNGAVHLALMNRLREVGFTLLGEEHPAAHELSLVFSELWALHRDTLERAAKVVPAPPEP